MSKYFIAYTFFKKDGGHGVGNMETDINTGINCIADIKAIEKSVIDDNIDWSNIVINTYIEFPDLRKY